MSEQKNYEVYTQVGDYFIPAIQLQIVKDKCLNILHVDKESAYRCRYLG